MGLHVIKCKQAVYWTQCLRSACSEVLIVHKFDIYYFTQISSLNKYQRSSSPSSPSPSTAASFAWHSSGNPSGPVWIGPAERAAMESIKLRYPRLYDAFGLLRQDVPTVCCAMTLQLPPFKLASSRPHAHDLFERAVASGRRSPPISTVSRITRSNPNASAPSSYIVSSTLLVRP